MAMNQRYTHFDHIAFTVPEGVKSGEPVRVGAVAGVAKIDRQPDGKATVWLDGSHMIDVAGALTEGQVVYIKSDRTLTATATAHLSELRAVARPEEGPGTSRAVSTLVNMGGLALGPLVGGVLAVTVDRPLVVPYEVFLVLLVVLGLGVALVPETVERREVQHVHEQPRPARRERREDLGPVQRPAPGGGLGAGGCVEEHGVVARLGDPEGEQLLRGGVLEDAAHGLRAEAVGVQRGAGDDEVHVHRQGGGGGGAGQAALDVHKNAHQGKVGVLCLSPEEGLGVAPEAAEFRAKHLEAINRFRNV